MSLTQILQLPAFSLAMSETEKASKYGVFCDLLYDLMSAVLLKLSQLYHSIFGRSAMEVKHAMFNFKATVNVS